MLKQAGVILVTTLIFIFIMSLLALACMELAILQTKMSQNDDQRRQTFAAAEAGLKLAEQAIVDNQPLPCIKPLSSTDLPTKPLSFWQQQCQAQFPYAKVYFVAEKLAYAPCCDITGLGKRKLTFYRLSSYAKINSAQTLLQTTFAHPSAIKCSKALNQKLLLGRLSWSQLA